MLIASGVGTILVAGASPTSAADSPKPKPPPGLAPVAPPAAPVPSGAIRPGFDSISYGGNDDLTYPCTGEVGCTPTAVALPFSMDFYGNTYNELFVNNNGNLTFGSSLATYTPYPLSGSGPPIIAPFFADLDTRTGATVSFGAGTVGGRQAFGVNWPGVGCYDENLLVLNDLQVLLIDRSDVAVGDFDIEFNYGYVQWDAGQASGGDGSCTNGTAARAGFASGTGAAGTSFELPGSGVNGAFLDSNAATGLIHGSVGSSQLGRYVFQFRGGEPPGPPSGGSQPAEQLIGSTCLGKGSIGNVSCGAVAEPVNTLTGAFVHAETDLAMASSGVPFEWTRTYTSADTESGRFGEGWTDTYQVSVEILPNGDALVKGDEGQRFTFPALGGGAFETPPAAMADLETVSGGYRLTTAEQLVYEFDSAGKLLSKRDRNGQGVTLTYDGSGRLQTVTDAAGHTATVAYNGGSLVSGVSLSDGRSVGYGYTSGRLTSVTDVRGKVWSYTYDGGGRLATVVDPLSHTQVSNVYDATSGRVTSQTDAVGKTTQFAWDAATQTATVTDPKNHVWKDVYVENVLFKRIDGTDDATELGFDSDLNGTSVKSPLGETTQMTYDGNGNLLTATAPASLDSAQKTFVYNSRNDPTTITDARNTVTSYTYTVAGNVETVTQGGEQQAAYTYDAQGRVLTATDANGKTTAYTYDAAGNVESVTQPDPDGPGPLGQPKTTFTYDSQGNVLTQVDPKGNAAGCGCAGQYTTTFTYNPAGQLLTETDPLGHVTTTNVYDDAGRLSSTTDANGHTTTYTYDSANRVLTETRPDPDGAGPLTAPVTTYTYDNAGNKATETDPRGHTTTFAYDSANRLVSTTGADPDGAGPQTAPVTTNSYDANGNLASTVEPRGNVSGANPNDYRTSYSYDAAGRLKTTTDPLGNVTTNVYDTVGNLQSVTDANGHTTAYTYDYAGRILTVTAPDPDGAGPLVAPVTTYTYDSAGNRLTRRDANNHTTSWTYDALNRAVSETWPDPDGAGAQTASLTTMAYDLNGNLLARTDPNGNATAAAGDGTTSYAYDRANRRTGIDYSGSTPDVTYTLDNVGNRLTMVDALGTETRTYDNLDRLLTVGHDETPFSYVYDPNGNVTRRTYPDATVYEYTYDSLDRMATVASGGVTLATYGYDAAGNELTHTRPASNGVVETRVVDRAGRVIEVKHERPAGGTATAPVAPTAVLEQTNLTGSLADIDDDPDAPDAAWMIATANTVNTSVRTGFPTPANAPSGVQTFKAQVRKRGGSATPTARIDLYENGALRASGQAVNVSSTTGQLVTQTFNLGAVSLADPTGAGVEARVVGTFAGNGGNRASVDVGAVRWHETYTTPQLLAGFVYTLDAVGNPTRVDRTGTLAGVQSFSYDNIDRLTAVCFQATCPGSGDPKIAWAYDGVGNRLSETRTTGTTMYTYDNADRLLSATGLGSFGYDANGNQTDSGGQTFVYDLENRLVSISGGTSYSYDGDGVRTGANTVLGSTTFKWDVNQPLPLLAWEQAVPGGPPPGDAGSLAPLGTTTRRYAYGTQELSQTTTTIGTPTTTTTLEAHQDRLGSIITTTTAAGSTQGAIDYEPYGIAHATSGSPNSQMRFTGQYQDLTGLYHLRARQYEPATGRFLQVDSAIPASEDPSRSAYAYADNEPLTNVDPSGRTIQPARVSTRTTGRAVTREMPERTLAAFPNVKSECFIEETQPVTLIGRRLHAEVEATCTGVSSAIHQACIAIKRSYVFGFITDWSDQVCGRMVTQTIGQRYAREPIRAYVRRTCESGSHKYRAVSRLNVTWISGRRFFDDTPSFTVRKFVC